MKIREIMTKNVIRISPEEPVAVAARILARYNIGVLPVCGADGRLCGLVTDRDLVIRCVAAGNDPKTTPVGRVMTSGIVSAQPDMEVSVAAGLMGRLQVRRLPVLENQRLCGMISLGDLAENEQTGYDAGDALSIISSNLSQR